MRKLSEIRGEDALDVLADILEPVSEIFTDTEFVELIRKGDKLAACKNVMRNHKKAILTVMAILDGKEVESYSPSVVELPALILSLLNDPDIVSVFHSAGQKSTSGSAMVNTVETGQE